MHSRAPRRGHLSPYAVVWRANLGIVFAISVGTLSCGNGPSASDSEDVFPVTWDRVTTASDGKKLTIQYGRGACSVLERVDVRESSDKVELTVLVSPNGKEGRGEDGEPACVGSEFVEQTSVELRASLGRREIIDGACNGKDAVACGKIENPPSEADDLNDEVP